MFRLKIVLNKGLLSQFILEHATHFCTQHCGNALTAWKISYEDHLRDRLPRKPHTGFLFGYPPLTEFLAAESNFID